MNEKGIKKDRVTLPGEEQNSPGDILMQEKRLSSVFITKERLAFFFFLLYCPPLNCP